MLDPHPTEQGVVELILGCSAFSLHHSWNCLVQNMIYVFCTLLQRDFPLPELLDAVHQFLFVAWLDLRLQVELELMPKVLNWVEVGTFQRGTPPVDVVLLEEGLCSSRGMLRVIVLHKPVVGKLLSDKRDKRGFQDVAEEIRIHDTIEDANLGGTLSAYSSPNMKF